MERTLKATSRILLLILAVSAAGLRAESDMPLFDAAFKNPRQYLNAVNTRKESAEKYFLRAKSLLLQGKFEKARILVEHLEANYPEFPEPYKAILRAWISLDDDDDAFDLDSVHKARQGFTAENQAQYRFFTEVIYARELLTKDALKIEAEPATLAQLDKVIAMASELRHPIALIYSNQLQMDNLSISLDIKEVQKVAADTVSRAEDIDYDLLRADAYSWSAWAFYWRDQFVEAEAFYARSNQLFEEVGHLSKLGENHILMADMYSVMANREPERAEAIQKSVEYYRASDSEFGFAEASRLYGTFLAEREDFDGAMEEFQRAQEIFRRIGNEADIAMTHYEISYAARLNGRQDLAVDNIELAKALIPKTDDWYNYSRILGEEVFVFLSSDFERAKTAAEELLALHLEGSSNHEVSHSYYTLGEVYLEHKFYAEAKVNLEKAKELVEENEDMEMQIRRSLSLTYAGLEEYEQAYQDLEYVVDLRRKKFDKDYANQLAALQDQLKAQSQENEIKRLQQEKLLQANEIAQRKFNNQVTIAGFMAFILIGFLLINRRSQMRQRRILERLVNQRTQQVIEQKNSISALLDNAAEGFLSFRRDFIVEGAYSSACEIIFQRAPAAEKISELIYIDNQPKQKTFERLMKIAFNAPQDERDNVLELLPAEVEIHQRNIAINYQFIEDYQVMLVLRDETEERRMLEALKAATITDKLTGIYNRHKLDSVMETEIDRAARGLGSFAIIVADIDRFKAINDKYGHSVGDEVLIQVAALLRRRLRKTDSVGRWGGEEFVIVCAGTDIEAACGLADSFRMELEFAEMPEVGHITASFGVAAYTENDTVRDLFNRADEALYRAKERGRNRVEAEG